MLAYLSFCDTRGSGGSDIPVPVGPFDVRGNRELKEEKEAEENRKKEITKERKKMAEEKARLEQLAQKVRPFYLQWLL